MDSTTTNRASRIFFFVFRLDSRIKRDIELTPEDILTILTLYENDRQHPPTGYRTSWQRFEPSLDLDGDREENDIDQDEESWLDTPVYPHASSQFNPGYFYEDKKKRFMVARKRNDPTRELRYLNGPNKNDFYTLSQLLSSQREPNVPVYHRVVL